MASNKWSFLWRKVARIRLPSSGFSGDHLRVNFGAAISNFCTIIPSSVTSDDIFCTNRNNNNNSSPQQQQQQPCTSNSSSVAAEFKVMSSAASSRPPRSLWPLLMLPSSEIYDIMEEEEGNYYEGYFCLEENRIKRIRCYIPEDITDGECIGASKGRIAFVSNLEDCRMCLFDPLYEGAGVLPSILSLPCFQEAIPIPVPVGNDYFPYIFEYKAADGTVMKSSAARLTRLLIKRFAVSSEWLYRKLDFVLMMCLGDGHGLVFARNGDPTFTPLPGSVEVEDLIYSKKDNLFYGIVTKDGKFQAWDFKNTGEDRASPRRIDFDFDIRYSDIDYPDFFNEQVGKNLHFVKHYLVETPEGEILFLARYSVSIGKDVSFVNAADFPDKVHWPIRTAFFAAFKLDFEKQIGVPIKSLGDAALFLGMNESFSLSTRDCPELTANSIYFTDDKDDRIYNNSYPYGGDDMGVYNFENYSVTPLYYPFQFKKIQPPPFWALKFRAVI